MKKLINLFSIGLIFVAPVVFIIVRYTRTTEEVPPETTLGAMGFVLIVGVAVVLLAFLKNLIHSHLQKNPLGSLAIIFYGLVMLAVFGALLYGSHYIVKEATERLLTLIETFEGYRYTMLWLTAFVGSGIALQGVNAWLTFKNK